MEQISLCLESTQPEPQELTQPNSANSSESPSSNDYQTAGVDSQIKGQHAKDQTLARETPKQDELKAEIVKIESKNTSLTSLKESGLATTENVKHFNGSPGSAEREKTKAEGTDFRCPKATKTACRGKKNHLRNIQSKYLQCLKT